MIPLTPAPVPSYYAAGGGEQAAMTHGVEIGPVATSDWARHLGISQRQWDRHRDEITREHPKHYVINRVFACRRCSAILNGHMRRLAEYDRNVAGWTGTGQLESSVVRESVRTWDSSAVSTVSPRATGTSTTKSESDA